MLISVFLIESLLSNPIPSFPLIVLLRSFFLIAPFYWVILTSASPIRLLTDVLSLRKSPLPFSPPPPLRFSSLHHGPSFPPPLQPPKRPMVFPPKRSSRSITFRYPLFFPRGSGNPPTPSLKKSFENTNDLILHNTSAPLPLLNLFPPSRPPCLSVVIDSPGNFSDRLFPARASRTRSFFPSFVLAPPSSPLFSP